MSDVALAEPHRAATPAAPDDKRSRPLKVTGRLKRALDLMTWGDGEQQYLSDSEAAVKTGMNVISIRVALQQPHVLAYYKRQREVLRASLLPGNIHRLRQIRDKADNMPAVNAIKVLEQLGDEQQQRGSDASASPGVTIRILNVVQSGSGETRSRLDVGTDARQINGLSDESA